MNQLSIETLENLDCVKNLDGIKKSFVLKLDNRKRLQNYLSVCNQLGFDKFCETCSPSGINREVVKELMSKQ